MDWIDPKPAPGPLAAVQDALYRARQVTTTTLSPTSSMQ